MLPIKSLDEIVENRIIDMWARQLTRLPSQPNRPHETDAELVELPGDREHYLAITIDTVAEEIAVGLYQDPYTMGWIVVIASVSDLAAVGASPLGMVISAAVEPDRDGEYTARIVQGMNDACRAAGAFVLGGDTNSAPATSLTTCAIGLAPREKVLTRRGCRPGDVVYLSGPVGAGNALGLMRLARMEEALFPEHLYRPQPRIKEGLLLRRFATACMDTSDGLLGTLDQLMRINQLGFVVDCQWDRILAPDVARFCRQSDTPYWLMTAGLHGEFELLFTVAADDEDAFVDAAESEGMAPIKIGVVKEAPAVTLSLSSGRLVNVDGAALRNLLYDVAGDLTRYVRTMRALGQEWGLEEVSQP